MKFNLNFSVNFNEQILLQLKKCSRLAHVSHMGVVSSCGHITILTDYYYYYKKCARSVPFCVRRSVLSNTNVILVESTISN